MVTSPRALTRALMLSCLVSLGARDSTAQLLEQQFSLAAGWNTVFLEVDPVPADADAVFATSPANAILRVHSWRSAGPNQRWTLLNPQDPNFAGDTVTGWQIWLPLAHPARFVNSLLKVEGGRVYLIECSQSASLVVRGVPDDTKTQWDPGYNIAGLYLDQSPHTFGSYFAPSSAHADLRVFGLSAAGQLAEVASAATTPAQPGRGYWIRSGAYATYDGPLSLNAARSAA